MRVTIDLDEDIFRAVKDLARVNHQSVGRVLSDLVHRGLKRPPLKLKMRNGVPIFPRKPGAKPVTDEDVKRLLNGLVE
jgi:hypothetical protein